MLQLFIIMNNTRLISGFLRVGYLLDIFGTGPDPTQPNPTHGCIRPMSLCSEKRERPYELLVKPPPEKRGLYSTAFVCLFVCLFVRPSVCSLVCRLQRVLAGAFRIGHSDRTG